MTPIVTGRGLVCRFGTNTVLDGVDLSVGAGQCLAVTGVNGSGRTTFLEVLSTLRTPSGGALEINGIDAMRSPHLARAQVALAAADLTRGDGLTVGEYLEVVRRARTAASTASPLAVAAVLERSRLHGRAFVDRLSRGQRVQLALSTALMTRPSLLLLDDPFASLDPEARTRFIDWVVEVRSSGSAVVAALNVGADIDAIATTTARLDGGRLVGAATRVDRADAPQALRLPNRVSGVR